MPDVSQKEIGKRLYHVHREKMVEEAIKKLKLGVGNEWSEFTREDIELLGHLLQCTWNVIDQKTWENLPFSSLKKDDVRKILSYGEESAREGTRTRRQSRKLKKYCFPAGHDIHIF